ncbi:MAG TPA: pilus assembly protein PilM, partial [Clostridia bacterium]|nr:pilus assembly protein PilM [Clostridia bacterium]
MLKLFGKRPPLRRVLALDGGSRRLKLLLAESDFGRVRILRQELVDVQAEGLVSAEEIQTHLQQLLGDCGRPPLALVMPQHLVISQIIDLPQAPEAEVDKQIRDETIKLSGVSESRIVYDFVRVETPSKNRQQFWVTLCQEGDIRDRIHKLGVEQEDLCEVTTTANALIAAYRAAAPDSARAILVHLGAQATVVVVLAAGQGAFATSFQMGGDFFTRTLARINNSAEESAEAQKCSQDLLNGPEAPSEFVTAVEGWVGELKRQLSEWFQQNPEFTANNQEFELIACGGGFDQPGLLEYLKAKAGLVLHPWPGGGQSDSSAPLKGYEVAFGTALEALGHSPQPVSLLPEDYRLAWKKHLGRQRVELASLVLLCVCVLVLALGTWRQLALISTKQALLDKVTAGQRAFNENDALTTELVSEYDHLRPVLAAHQNSLDTLRTFSLLQLSRTNRNFWYVLLCDQQSYFSQPPALTTNRPAKTNLLGAAIDTSRTGALGLRALATGVTNVSLAKSGLIAELCIPGDAEAARQVLS